MKANTCNHLTFFLFDGQARCLCKLFAQGAVKAISREVTRDGVEFLIWSDTLHKNKKGRYAGKYNLFGTRSRIRSRDQILLAIELAEKYNIQRVRL